MILALDLGTKCGWACSEKASGVWNLKPSKFESAGQRYLSFRLKLFNLCCETALIGEQITSIVFEEVRNHRAINAAHVYGGLMAILQTFCLERKIEYKGVPVGTLKKYATGKGNAEKVDMIKAAQKFYPAVNILDDNHADALCLLHYATQNFIY